MKRKSQLMRGGALVVVSAFLVAMVVLTPAPTSEFEPEWLSKIKPKSRERTFIEVAQPRVVYKHRREFRQPISEVVAKLNASLTPQDGWTLSHRSKWQVTWVKNDLPSQQGYTVSLTTMGDPCTLVTSHSRRLTRLETWQRSLRKFFGIKEERKSS